MNGDDVIKMWNEADPKTIHPTRRISEDEYWASGQSQAELLSQDIPAKARVIDFGCGDGRVAIPLSELGYEVTGYDTSETMLASYTSNAETRRTPWSIIHDLKAVPNATGHFDALYCLAVLIHQSYDDARAMLKLMVEVVKPGGILCLDWPVSDSPHERTHWIDVTTWSKEAQDQYALELGLTRVDTASDHPWFVFRKNV